MVVSRKEHKNGYQLNVRLIFGLIVALSFFTIIIFTTMLSTSENSFTKKNNKISNSQNEPVFDLNEEANKDNILAVVRMIDTDGKQITVYDVLGQKEEKLQYTGGTNATDRYGQVISISQLELGNMVDVTFMRASKKVTDISISSRAWKYVGVNNFALDTSTDIMKIAKKQYKLNDGLTIFDGNEIIPLNDIAEQDVLTVWGYEETIYSITVTRGHGFVILQDYTDYLGDSITIGHESMQQITEEMMITVREGEYNLTVENKDYSATMRVNIDRNKITYVSLKDLGPDAKKIGRVKFDISPFGADLSINGELRSYANDLELPYGKYSIKVSLGGYITYSGILNVDSPGKTIKVSLPETTSDQKVEITETDTLNNSQGNNTSNPQDQNGQQDNSQDSNNNAGNNSSTGNGTNYELDGDKIIDKKHQIHIQNPAGASVYLNGEYMGTSPVNFNKIIGSHVITFIEEGHETMSYIIEVLNDGTDAYFTFPDLKSSTKIIN